MANRIVRLTEADLTRLIRRVIQEQPVLPYQPQPQTQKNPFAFNGTVPGGAAPKSTQPTGGQKVTPENAPLCKTKGWGAVGLYLKGGYIKDEKSGNILCKTSSHGSGYKDEKYIKSPSCATLNSVRGQYFSGFMFKDRILNTPICKTEGPDPTPTSAPKTGGMGPNAGGVVR